MGELDAVWPHLPTTCDRVRTDYRAAGLSHLVCGPVWSDHGYDGEYPLTDYLGHPERYVEFLRWWGMPFTLMLLPDSEPYFDGRQWDMGLIERDLTPFYSHPEIQALTTRVCLAYECVVSIANFVPVFDWMLRIFPHATRFWHNPPGHLSPGLSDEDEQECWRSAARHGIDGLMLQASPSGTALPPIEQMAYDLWDMERRFTGVNSPWGKPILNLHGQPLTVEYGEGVAYPMYHDAAPQSLAVAWGTKARTVQGVVNTLDGSPLRLQ